MRSPNIERELYKGTKNINKNPTFFTSDLFRKLYNKYLTMSGDSVNPFMEYIKLGGKLIEKPKDGSTCGCMDERCMCNTKLAGSGIFHIYNMIKHGKTNEQIIESLRETINAGNINKVTSHEDCGAAKLFCEAFCKDNSCKQDEILNKLSETLPGIDDGFNQEYTPDNIVARIIKYFAGELGVKYEHIELPKDNLGNILPHFSRSMFINLTGYDIPYSLKSAGLEQGFCCDIGKFLNVEHFSDLLNGIIGQICNEIIVGKYIANKNIGISEYKKMQIAFVINKGDEKQAKVARMIKSLVERFIREKHSDFIGKYDFHVIET